MNIPSVPHLLHIETTYACNQNCRFCYNPNRNAKIDFTVIDKIVESVFDSWVPHVYLIGGEPSLLGVERLNKYIDLLSQRSSVTIVTNGQIYLKGISSNLACIGVPIHGLEDSHDFLANKKGSFQNAVNSIIHYVEDGFDVRCIPVLTSSNHAQMYAVIELASSLGMESIFVDRYEDGGIGSILSSELKPSLSQFREALTQMISARDDFKIPVGWGTAIPFCLDERLISENMFADCGAGITFCAVNPKGDVRVCNQSEIVYGNILKEKIENVWHKPELSDFRDLKWVEKPCTECFALTDCMCGCKVDASKSDSYCIDYAVRENGCFHKVEKMPSENVQEYSIPDEFRNFTLNRYTRLNKYHSEKYLVTRYQTIILENLALDLLEQIINGVSSESELIKQNIDDIEEKEIRRFVSILEYVKAINIIE